MSEHLRKHFPLIDFLSSGLTRNQLKAVLKTLSNAQATVLGEIALNVLYGRLKLSDSVKTKLRKSAPQIEFISNKENSLTSRKKAITRNFGTIEILLEAVKPQIIALLE